MQGGTAAAAAGGGDGGLGEPLLGGETAGPTTPQERPEEQTESPAGGSGTELAGGGAASQVPEDDGYGDDAPPTPVGEDDDIPEEKEGNPVDTEPHEAPPHLFRFDDERTLWSSNVTFHALSLCAINIMGYGRDQIIVTSHRVIVARTRAIPPNFSQRYVATMLRRRDVTTVSLTRCVRFIKAFYVWTLIWLVLAIYIFSQRFLSKGDSPAWTESNWTLAGVIVGFIVVIALFFSNDWLVTISYVDRGLNGLSKGKVSARMTGPEDVACLEEAIRSGYVGGGGWIEDASTQRKRGGKGFTATRQLSPGEVADAKGTRKSGVLEKLTADDVASIVMYDSDEEPVKKSVDDQVRALHKRLLPGEKVVYRCKHHIRLFCCIPVGNNTLTVTNKRLLVKRARYPCLGSRNKWLSRYSFASIPVADVRTFQHGFIRLFGIQRFVWATGILHVALVFFWLRKNEDLCYPPPPEAPHEYCTTWLPELPELLLRLDSLIYLLVAASFFVFMLLFQFTRGWGLILYPGGGSHMSVEELRIALSGPEQMNCVEHAVRTGTCLDDQPLAQRRPDGFVMPGESVIGVAECNNGKVVVTDKRLVICKNHIENRGFVRRRILFWFRDYRVGTVDIKDVIASATRWIPLHDRWFMFAALWVGLWCCLLGSIFRGGACNGRKFTLYCNDLISLGLQILGAVLVVYWVWAFLKHRTQGLVFAAARVSTARENTDFLRCRVEPKAVNVVQEWLKHVQSEMQHEFLPETEEHEQLAERTACTYSHLILLQENQLRMYSEEMPVPGRHVLLSLDGRQVRWRAVKQTLGGGVILECQNSSGALKHGKIGDDFGAGSWDDAPPTPTSERYEKENIRLREWQRHHDAETHALHERIDALRHAYNEQTMRLIACNEELEKTRQDREDQMRSHRRDRHLLEAALVPQAVHATSAAHADTVLDMSAPPTPEQSPLRVESPPLGPPPMDTPPDLPLTIASASPARSGYGSAVRGGESAAHNPLLLSDAAAVASARRRDVYHEDIVVDTPPESPLGHLPYQLQSYRSPYQRTAV